MGHLRLTIGYLKATVVHIRVTLGHLKVTIGRGIIILFVQMSQGHENSRKCNFYLKKCINQLHVMSLVWNEPWFI